MAGKNDMLHITLKIGTHQFPMDVVRDDEFYYREAEKLINSRYRFYADRYPGQGNETYLMMTLIEIAVRFKQLESSADNAPMLSALKSLLKDVEDELA